MSTSNKSSLTTVSVLDGLNYLIWESQMKAWLRSKGLWQITCSNKKRFPQAADTESVTIRQASYNSQMEWDNKDNQTYGLILLHVNLSVAAFDLTSCKPVSGCIGCFQCHSKCCMASLKSCLQTDWPLSYLHWIQKCYLLENLYGKSHTQHHGNEELSVPYGCSSPYPWNCAGNDPA